MSTMVSQITSASIVYSIVCSDADQRKHHPKICVTGLCEGNSPVTDVFYAQRSSNAEMFPFDDIIMAVMDPASKSLA